MCARRLSLSIADIARRRRDMIAGMSTGDQCRQTSPHAAVMARVTLGWLLTWS
jgi:hypothetical protein